MGLFLKRNKTSGKTNGIVQTSPAAAFNSHPFAAINNYVPLTSGELGLFKSLREAIPIIDAAILKTVRLIGTFDIVCNQKSAQQGIDKFINNVKCGGCNYGLHSFIYSYFDQLITFGTAIGEMVLSNDNNTVEALYNASLEDIQLKAGDNPLDVKICRRDTTGDKLLPYQQLLLLSLLNPDQGTIKGNSILKGLPFVSSILLKIFNTIGTNWERVGNVRFAVTYKPSNETSITNTKERAMEIADQWSKAMRDQGTVCDFVSVGDVSIKVIGSDNQILDCDVPIKHILEQIISKLGIPPFLLGLSWSSTERMSSQQSDILTSELDYYRTILNPTISKICSMWLRLNGFDDEFEICWSNINLQDEIELAKSRLINAQALKLEQELGVSTEVKG